MCYYLIVNGALRWVRECVDFTMVLDDFGVKLPISWVQGNGKNQKNQVFTEHSTELILG